ncbi:MAG: hypothetical protein IKE62_01170 [Oscillospiraceae bacterium]|nr:hypothetical protein [Oscillospiraceae bacterium]
MKSKKLPAHGCNHERGAEKTVISEDNSFRVHSITGDGDLARVLLTGRQRALSARELTQILGMQNLRDVSSRVEAERLKGIPICASCDSTNPGYYLAADQQELAEYLRSLRRRLEHVQATLDALERTFDRWTGQVNLFEGGILHE